MIYAILLATVDSALGARATPSCGPEVYLQVLARTFQLDK